MRGALNYCISCFRRGHRWWRTNKMTQRLEFRYIQDIQDEDDVNEWEDCVWFLLFLTMGCDRRGCSKFGGSSGVDTF